MRINSKARSFIFIIICIFLIPLNSDAQKSGKKSKSLKKTIPSHSYRDVLKKPDLNVKLIPLYRKIHVTELKAIKKPLFEPGISLSGKFSIKVSNTGKISTPDTYVDLVLSKDKLIPLKSASYSSKFYEAVHLLGCKINVKGLKPGSQIDLKVPRLCKIPGKIKAGDYFLGAMIDPDNLIKERNEKNNLSLIRIRIKAILYQPITIDNIKQTGVWPSASGHFEMTLNGTGFGNTIGTRIVRVGTHSFGSGNMEYWSPNQVIVTFPYDFPLGNFYNIWVEDGGIRISNLMKNVMLYMDLSATEWADGNGNPISPEAQANTIITMKGLFGATQGANLVRFGSASAQVISWNNSYIKFRIPNLTPGPYKVFVERNGIRVSFEATFTILP